MARRFYPTPNEMNVKRYLKPTAETTKTKEKLKNPQQPRAQAPESQEGLKRLRKPTDAMIDVARISRRVETTHVLPAAD